MFTHPDDNYQLSIINYQLKTLHLQKHLNQKKNETKNLSTSVALREAV